MTQAVPEMTPYSTAVPFFSATPSGWIPEEDRQRIQAYQIYEQMYWNVPETFRVQARGDENKAIYLPTARIVVDTLNRYVATGLDFRIEGAASDEAAAEIKATFVRLFRRERWKTQYASAKKFGLIRGDWAFHIFADEAKPEGSRISIKAIDPGSLFKVVDEDDLDRVQAWHIAEQFIDDDGDEFIRRQTYSRGPAWDDPEQDDGKIYFSQLVFEVDEWSEPGASALTQEIPVYALPDAITSLPIYHIAHQEEPQNPWGSSELRGHERLIGAINQSISDEDVSLALEGLGMYVTTSGPPVDEETGQEVEWRLGPGRVVEVASSDAANKVKDIFDRVTGVSSVEPFQAHLKFLMANLYEATRANDVARGSVDASTAESGIALALRMFPLVQHAIEVDATVEDRLSQMYFDLKSWFQAFEGVTMPPEVEIVPTFGPKMPENRQSRIDEILAIVQNKIASTEWGRVELAKWGYEFSKDEDNDILEVEAARAMAADPFAARTDEELDAEEGGGNGEAQ